MRVLVLSNLYPPDGYGGYELTCRDVADRFARRGHAVLVLTSDLRVTDGLTGDQPSPTQAPVADVRRVLPMTWERARPSSRLASLARAFRSDRMLRRAVRGFRPDVISVWNPSGFSGVLVGRLPDLGPPVVWIFADAWPARFLEGDPWIAPLSARPTMARVVRLFTRLPTGLPEPGEGAACFCSRDLRQRIAASTGWRVDDGVVAPLGIDPDDFPGDRRSDPAAWSWRLLYVGRLDAGKGVDTLLRALPAINTATLTIVGPPEPAHLARLNSLIEGLRLGSRVTLTSLPRDQLAPVYRQADVCVFPSEWAEPFGIVPLEAMASQTPVVATGVGGSGEYLVDGENCLEFAPGDAESLVAALHKLAADADLREHLIRGGRRTAERLTVDRLADQLEDVHRRATAKGSGT